MTIIIESDWRTAMDMWLDKIGNGACRAWMLDLPAGTSRAEAVAQCPRGEWLLDFAAAQPEAVDADGATRLVRVAAAYARAELPLVGDADREACQHAVDVTERVGRGEAVPYEVTWPAYREVRWAHGVVKSAARAASRAGEHDYPAVPSWAAATAARAAATPGLALPTADAVRAMLGW